MSDAGRSTSLTVGTGTKLFDLHRDLVMTPYESMMWNVWLPRVRSAVKYVSPPLLVLRSETDQTFFLSPATNGPPSSPLRLFISSTPGKPSYLASFTTTFSTSLSCLRSTRRSLIGSLGRPGPRSRASSSPGCPSSERGWRMSLGTLNVGFAGY